MTIIQTNKDKITLACLCLWLRLIDDSCKYASQTENPERREFWKGKAELYSQEYESALAKFLLSKTDLL